MHAVRRALLDAQAQAVGLPLWPVPLPSPCSNAEYDAAMTQVLERARAAGISVVAFGDLFLEDIRRYREERLAATSVTPLFPLWGQPTASLARDMIDSHLRTAVTCVDPRQLAPAFAGRSFDASFLADLPLTVDPCGERGEFHTFAWDGPMFTEPMAVQVVETVEHDGFIFTDLQAGQHSHIDQAG
jgi:diphthamide synthase (EF-2-diphthine--ammonia ligase)